MFSTSEQALVEHCGENVHVGSILLVQYVLVEVCEVEIDDDVIKEDVMLQGLVVVEGDGDVGAVAHGELAQLVVVLQLVLGP